MQLSKRSSFLDEYQQLLHTQMCLVIECTGPQLWCPRYSSSRYQDWSLISPVEDCILPQFPCVSCCWWAFCWRNWAEGLDCTVPDWRRFIHLSGKIYQISYMEQSLLANLRKHSNMALLAQRDWRLICISYGLLTLASGKASSKVGQVDNYCVNCYHVATCHSHSVCIWHSDSDLLLRLALALPLAGVNRPLVNKFYSVHHMYTATWSFDHWRLIMEENMKCSINPDQSFPGIETNHNALNDILVSIG